MGWAVKIVLIADRPCALSFAKYSCEDNLYYYVIRFLPFSFVWQLAGWSDPSPKKKRIDQLLTCVGFDDFSRILLLRRAFTLPNFDSSFPYQIVRMIMVRNYRKSRFSGEMFDSVSSEASRRIPRMCRADQYAFLRTRVTSPSELLRERKRQNPYHVVV